MATRDARRFAGPEKSFPYSLLQPPGDLSFLNTNSERKDGRSSLDTRNLFMSVGSISQAKGSSYVEYGDTKVTCGVYGPKEVVRGFDFKMTGQVLCEVKFAPFSCPIRRSPQPDKNQREISRQVKDALEAVIILEKFPKLQIDVYITVIEDNGGVLAACLTAAGLALCHANIDVQDIVVGASLLWHEGVAYADPSRHEEECLHRDTLCIGGEGGGQLTIGMMPSHASGQVVLFLQEGELSTDNVTEGTDLALEMCHQIHEISRQTLLDHMERNLGVGSQ